MARKLRVTLDLMLDDDDTDLHDLGQQIVETLEEATIGDDEEPIAEIMDVKPAEEG